MSNPEEEGSAWARCILTFIDTYGQASALDYNRKAPAKDGFEVGGIRIHKTEILKGFSCGYATKDDVFVSPAVMESIEDYAGQGRLEWILSRVRVYKMPTPRDFHREREQWSTR